MRILKSPKVLSVKKLHADGVGCEWFTLREGNEVSDDLVELIEKKGGVLGKEKVKKEPEEEVKPVLQETAEIVNGSV